MEVKKILCKVLNCPDSEGFKNYPFIIFNTQIDHESPALIYDLCVSSCYVLMLQPEKDIIQLMDTSSASSPLMDAERTLGLLCGLHASHLARSTPLSQEEREGCEWLQSDVFRGGLQLLQPRNPFEEEKGESRTPTSSATTPGNARPFPG